MRFVSIMMMWFFCGVPNICEASYYINQACADDEAWDPEEEEEDGGTEEPEEDEET